MLQEDTAVALKRPLPEHALDSGALGVVVHVHGQGADYEVEFLTQDGHTVCVETLQLENLAPAPLSAVGEDARRDLLQSEESRKKSRLPADCIRRLPVKKVGKVLVGPSLPVRHVAAVEKGKRAEWPAASGPQRREVGFRCWFDMRRSRDAITVTQPVRIRSPGRTAGSGGKGELPARPFQVV